MLQISGKDIVDARGEKVFLRGIALGGWLMMEGYMLGGENIPETKFRDGLAAQIGEAGAEEFNWEFRRRFFTEQDADRIKKLGINCVRIPFNHKLIEISPFKIDSRSMEFLKTVVSWFAEREIYVILDMHAVPGCQNRDWHSDSEGEMDFYTNPESRERFVYLWKELSGIFK
ncbi:MAG: cellulase family glycosylhydrolase, partial [Candidatus Margulisiibacteriota bacterium]